MCQYCGCHEITTVGELMDDHFEIRNLVGHIKTAVGADDHDEAVRLIRELQRRFTVHNTVEEAGLYLAMTRFPEHEDKAATLYDEHDSLDAVIDDIFAAHDAGRIGEVDWSPLLTEFDVLMEHIDHEENGLFPAAAVALDPEDWDRCENLRVEAVNKLDRPLWSEQGQSSWAQHNSSHTHDHGHPHSHA